MRRPLLVNVVLTCLSFCEAYINDLVVCSESWVEHLEHLCAVFCSLKEVGLTVNLSNSEFGQATVTYLGKVVGEVRWSVLWHFLFQPPELSFAVI